jgi:hypothetical protein
MASSDINLNNIGFQSQLRDKPVQQNFSDIQNNFNALRAEVYASIASTASEVTSARDNFGNLTDNIHIRRVYNDGVATGGIITAQGTPDNTVRVSAGEAVVNGVGCDWSSATSGTVAAVTVASRKIVAAVNSDKTISLELGATGTSNLPTISSTQRPLAIISQDTASPAVFESGDILDARNQGCFMPRRREWKFKIQDAINALGGTLGGDIIIGAGNYYEDLSYKSNQKLIFESGANLYTLNGTAVTFREIDTSSLTNTKIEYTKPKYYDTGWINRSDWTNQHLGSDTSKNTDSNVSHGLNSNLSYITVKVLISSDGTDANAIEIPNSFYSYADDPTYRDLGVTVYQVDNDNVLVQTGFSGLAYLDSSGGEAIVTTQDWYYKVVVFKLIDM